MHLTYIANHTTYELWMNCIQEPFIVFDFNWLDYFNVFFKALQKKMIT